MSRKTLCVQKTQESHRHLTISLFSIFNFIDDNLSATNALIVVIDSFERDLYESSRSSQNHQDIIDHVFTNWVAGNPKGIRVCQKLLWKC